MTVLRVVLAVLLAMSGLTMTAQAQVKPKEFYFDQDAATARRIVVVEGEGDALAAELVKARERGRRQMEATAQLAHVAMTENRPDLGKSLYDVAVQGTQPNSSVGRSVRWNYAWDLHRIGDTAAALEYWAELARGYGQPAWLPPTLALSLWENDRKPEALQWYAAAVRTEPNLWNDPANFNTLLPEWREQDRQRLVEVYNAWATNPPAWP